MQLSYTLRLVCLVLFSAGLVRVFLTALLRLLVPALAPMIATQSARFQERMWFALSLAPYAIAALISICIAGPNYLFHENNLGSEYVGWACVAGAAITCFGHGVIALRCLRLGYAMRGCPSEISATAHHAAPLLAVTGLFRARIAASPRALSGEVFSRESLAVAIAHEESHLKQWDNMKLLLLSSISPQGRKNTDVQHWRRAAEQAADDDAVAGSRQRAILLAEALTAAARAASGSPAPAAFAVELLPYECELEERVNRLLDPQSVESAAASLRMLPLCLVLLTLVAVFLLPASPEFTEFVLHLG